VHSTGTGDDRHAAAVAAFAAGWLDPHPHAWDDLLAPDVQLEQPLLESGTGIELWQRGLAQVLELLPDLRARVLRWAADGDELFIEVELSATLGGRPYAYRAVDRLTLDAGGRVTHRRSFLDPGPLALTIARRPRAWLPWWRSGLPPLAARRHLRGRTVLALGATRTLVGATALASPSLARRSLGLRGPGDDGGMLTRMFGVRDGVLGLATLFSAGDTALRLGALADVSDIAAVTLGRRQGRVTRGGALVIGGAAAAFAMAGALAIAARPRSGRSTPSGASPGKCR
jgi:SnoaL-like domain